MADETLDPREKARLVAAEKQAREDRAADARKAHIANQRRMLLGRYGIEPEDEDE